MHVCASINSARVSIFGAIARMTTRRPSTDPKAVICRQRFAELVSFTFVNQQSAQCRFVSLSLFRLVLGFSFVGDLRSFVARNLIVFTFKCGSSRATLTAGPAVSPRPRAPFSPVPGDQLPRSIKPFALHNATAAGEMCQKRFRPEISCVT